MRTRGPRFASTDDQLVKSPRHVVNIIFPTGSLYITSAAGIPSVPGFPLEGMLKRPTIQSQRIVPDQGRAEIGAASFDVLDVGEAFTAAIRSKLAGGKGLRGRTVKFYRGFEGFDFTEFELEATQIIHAEANYEAGVYTIQCRDITRELRQDIFERVTTVTTAAITATQTTIPARDTSRFFRVKHDASYSDAPSATVGYIKIKNEIIRYTAADALNFVGCTRGVFGTLPAAYGFDAAVAAERQEQIDEFIYLEGPFVKILEAVLTGVLHGDSASLPAAWHCGIDPTFLRLTDFTGIGTDLWDPADPTVGIPCRFEALSKTNAKDFIGRELLTPLACFSPVYADGTMGLRRRLRVSRDAAFVAVLNESNSVQSGSLTHSMTMLHNRFIVDWNWDGSIFTHRNAFFDETSVDIHGRSDMYVQQFKGIHSGNPKHTDVFIFDMLDRWRDAYSGPPELMTVELLHRLNRIEVGDVVRVRYASIRDFAGPAGAIDRSFEVQGVTDTGTKVTLELFGSTAIPSIRSPSAASTALPDAFYTAVGTALSAVAGVTIAANHLTVAPGTPIAGGTTVAASGSVFYHNADLTIDAGVNLKISGNWWLRVRGALIINGTINGKGGGLAGVADSGATLFVSGPTDITSSDSLDVAIYNTIPGTPGYVGGSAGSEGIQFRQLRTASQLHHVPCASTPGRNHAAPHLALVVSGNSLILPAGLDLRGTGGPPGGRITETGAETSHLGGSGAAGGAGLLITCRGMGFGGSGAINLDGNDSVAPTVVNNVGGPQYDVYPGSGGAGGPGTMYVFIDGAAISLPSIGVTNFSAKTGTVPLQGNPLPQRDKNRAQDSLMKPLEPLRAFDIPGIISAVDHFTTPDGAALHKQYVPASTTANPDVKLPPPAPTGLTAVGSAGIISGIITLPINLAPSVLTRIYVSITNNLPDATLQVQAKTDGFALSSPVGTLKYFWATTWDSATGRESSFFPLGPTTSVSASAQASGSTHLITRGNAVADGTSVTKVGGVLGWDSDAYSEDGGVNGCVMSCRFGDPTKNAMSGINADPVTDRSYASIDYAWYGSSDGLLYQFESGAQIGGNYGAYTSATQLAIVYEKGEVRYYKGGGLVRTARTTSGRTFFYDSSLYAPGSIINGIAFNGIAPANENRDPSTVFLETWEAQSWADRYNDIANAAATLTYPTNGLLGGRVIRVAGNQIWIEHATNIPYEPGMMYRITARVRRIAAGGGVGFEYCYVGVSGIGADGTTRINTAGVDTGGGQHYNCLNGFDLSAVALNLWVDAIGYFRGNSTSAGGVAVHRDAPTTLYTGVKYFRPLLIMNFNHGTGTQECDFIKVERLITPDDSDNSNKQRLVPDAEFALATDQTHWYLSKASGANTPTISLTGGNVAGRALITAASAAQAIISRRYGPLQAVVEEKWTVRMRWRRTSTMTGSDPKFLLATVVRHDVLPSVATFPAAIGTTTFNLGGIALTIAEVNARTVNVWYEDAATCMVSYYLTYSGGDLPYISLQAGIETQTGGSIEIDYLNASPGDGAEMVHIYTATGDVYQDYAFSRIVYDSASAGTLTVPFAFNSTEGSRLRFVQNGAGLLTIGKNPGSLQHLWSPINTDANRALTGKFAQAEAICKRAPDGTLGWYLTGDLA